MTLYVTAVLRALARTTEEQIDSGRWNMKTESGGRSFSLEFSLPDLLSASPPACRDDGHVQQVETERFLRGVQRLVGNQVRTKAQLNNLYRKLSGKRFDQIPFPNPNTPLEKAQELAFQARSTRGRRRIVLAKQALALCPDCADAFCVFAEEESDPDVALAYWEKAVDAGERALGPARFVEAKDHPFWGDVTTRPYMRALLGRAFTQKIAGRLEDAAAGFHRMLELNPEDNQGVRDFLAGLLLDLERHQELEALLNRYKNDFMGTFFYAKALLVFRQEGDSARARRALAQARQWNTHAPAILAGDKPSPGNVSTYCLGDEGEAVLIDDIQGRAWRSTPGAIAWLKSGGKRRSPKKKPSLLRKFLKPPPPP